MNRRPRPAFVALLIVVTQPILSGCATHGSRDAQPAPADANTHERSGAPGPSEPIVLSAQPWSFGNVTGQVVLTRHYRIFTTEDEAALMGRLPGFLEAALAHYRTIITPLPAPPLRLDTYLMDNRPQWVRLTRRLLGAAGERFTRIQRGGFATRGIGVFYDIGVFDTLSVAAHEGWHQYTQRTFGDRLPIWLEEGLATFMEGHKWDGVEPIFLPWANVERFDQLRTAHADGSLLGLKDLLATAPQDSGAARGEALVTYYAQVWALAHYLNEGEGGRYRPDLRAIVADAADGNLRRTLLVRLGRVDGARAIASGRGAGVLRAYLGVPIDELADGYARFIGRVVARGSRDQIVAGRSPIRDTP